MKTQFTNYFVALFATCFLLACESNEEPTLTLQLDEVGFVGSLPDGGSFSSSGIKSANSAGLSGTSSEGGFVNHGLSIRDYISGIDIYLQLPEKKFQESSEILGLDAVEIANEYYDYDRVKEKLAVGNKNIPFEITDKWENNFYLTVLDQRNYNGYTLRPGLLDVGNFLKVTQL
jgi:hypothetical protein